MEQMKNGATRKQRHLRVPVLPDEEAAIKRQAAAAGLSVAAYLRNVGLGYEIRGVLDHQRVNELAKINGDLGRLGGLLKLWLTNDEKLAGYSVAEKRRLIHDLLDRIRDTQGAMLEVVKKI
jgi:hypothetical protein